MAAILQSLGRTIIAGIVLLILLVMIASSIAGAGPQMGHAWGAFVMRWLHVVSGIMWIGLLWYFNFVQIPSMPKIPDEQKPAIGKVIAPTALFWFRWAALATVITGLLVAWMRHYLGAFNVWFIIWPNQKKALGIVTVEPEQKAAAARLAMLTSRFNTMLSIPMLYMMVAQQNGGLQ